MNLADFQALTFDCYGTLIDWETGILNELRPWLAAHGKTLDDDRILESFGAAESAAEAATPAKLYPDILADVVRALGRRWNIPVSAAEAGEFGRSVGRWPAFPDSAEALRYLKRHYKLVILSNVDRASFAASNEKLEVAFDLVVTAQDVGSYKPDPRNFRRLLRELARLGVGQAQVLHTAQSRFHDIAPAQALGLATMWINRRKGRAGAGATPAVPSTVKSDLEAASMAEFVRLHRAEFGG